MNRYTCACGKTLSFTSYSYHSKICDGYPKVKKTEASKICPVCQAEFVYKAFNKHLKNFHKLNPYNLLPLDIEEKQKNAPLNIQIDGSNLYNQGQELLNTSIPLLSSSSIQLQNFSTSSTTIIKHPEVTINESEYQANLLPSFVIPKQINNVVQNALDKSEFNQRSKFTYHSTSISFTHSNSKRHKLKARKQKRFLKKKKIVIKQKKIKKKRDEYVYDNLEYLAKTEKDRLFTFAVVIDCSPPYKNESKEDQKQICVAKIIDSSIKKNEYVSATFYARQKDQIPQPYKIGSIIRIHRGQSKEYKGKFQINCDVSLKAAWVLFDPIEGILPISQTGKNITWTEKDNIRLKEIRQFSYDFFKMNEMEYTSLNRLIIEKQNTYGPVCKVLVVKEKGDKRKFIFCDEGCAAKLIVCFDNFQSIGPGDIVRLSCASYDEYDKEIKMLKANKYTNILRVPDEYLSAKKLNQSLKTKTINDEINWLFKYYTPEPNKENVISKILNKNIEAIELKYLSKKIYEGKRIFKISVTAIKVVPDNYNDWLFVYDKETKEIRKPQNIFGKQLDKYLHYPKEYVYKMQMFVKDKSVMENSDIYLINLNSCDGKGTEFINIGLEKEEPTKVHYKKLKYLYSIITRPWNTLELIVEAVELDNHSFALYIIDTEITFSFHEELISLI